jgi:hypothetical protein
MDLRKSTSNKKQAVQLPGDARDLIKGTIEDGFADTLPSNLKLSVDGYVFLEEVFLRITLAEKDSIRPMNFESSVDFDSKKGRTLELFTISLDALSPLITSFFEKNSDDDLPLYWLPVEIGEDTVFVQTSRVNPEIEAQADELLGESIGLDDDADVAFFETVLNDFKESLDGIGDRTLH